MHRDRPSQCPNALLPLAVAAAATLLAVACAAGAGVSPLSTGVLPVGDATPAGGCPRGLAPLQAGAPVDWHPCRWRCPSRALCPRVQCPAKRPPLWGGFARRSSGRRRHCPTVPQPMGAAVAGASPRGASARGSNTRTRHPCSWAQVAALLATLLASAAASNAASGAPAGYQPR
ncbi:hypothetical protein C4D60_Mb04t16440 [Musa balbisiana]|uniref:Uncharacterized protein n=1 Tax=Musa balbisiana TaxID=52838 RepID=A0A4S8KCJ9_MUSBA|nr:hypothetical protein C4D60_Mb04t16440 [Musa balbisiana]